jgi:peptide/nickel transport system substrate-binding protein
VLGRPKIDEIEVKFINDGNTLLANLLAGTVEMVLDRSVSLDYGMQVKDRWTAGQMGVGYAGWVNMYTQFLNPDPPIMSDVRFRRALLHSIDRQQLVDVLQFGLSSVPHSLYGPHNVEYTAIEPRIIKYEYDPRKAAQMITDLGFTRGADGMFRDSSGERLVVHLWALAGDDTNVKPLLAVADYFKQAGVTPEPNLVSEQAANDSAMRANFPSYSVQGGADGQSGIPRLHSREARVAETNYRGSNYTRYRNADLDALVDRYFATIPLDERTRVLGDIVNHTTDVLTNFGLFWRMAPSFIPNRMVNVQGANNLGTQSWNAHLWDVR